MHISEKKIYLSFKNMCKILSIFSCNMFNFLVTSALRGTEWFYIYYFIFIILYKNYRTALTRLFFTLLCNKRDLPTGHPWLKFLLSSIVYKRRKYWNRKKNFELQILDVFACFWMSWTRFHYFYKIFVCLSVLTQIIWLRKRKNWCKELHILYFTAS